MKRLLLIILLLLIGCSSTDTATLPATATPSPDPLPISITENVAYTEPLGSGRTNRLDVYAPDTQGGWPTIIVLHGSGEGKSTNQPWQTALAEQGAVVFGVDWPVGTARSLISNNGMRLRNATESVACAIGFAAATTTNYGGNPNDVTVVGFSAGAAIGALVTFGGDQLDAIWQQVEADRGRPAAQSGCIHGWDGSVPVDFVGVGGAYRFDLAMREFDTEIADQFNLNDFVTNNQNVTVHLIHGGSDTVSPPSQSESLQAVLEEAEVNSTLTLVPGKGHSVMIVESTPLILSQARDR